MLVSAQMADKGKVKKKKKVKKGKRLHLIAEFCKQRTRLHVTGKTNKKKRKKEKVTGDALYTRFDQHRVLFK